MRLRVLAFLSFVFLWSCDRGGRQGREPMIVDLNPVAPTPAPAPAPIPPGPEPILPDETFVGAGDIAVCGSQANEATARLLDGLSGTVFTLGDNVYPFASAKAFLDCYQPTWGRHKSRTRPSPGNHDWEDGGSSYFRYFGSSAGPAGLGYYSYDLGNWRIFSLNSEIDMGPGSTQLQWLQIELEAEIAKERRFQGPRCQVAYWHRPLFSSGQVNSGSDKVRPAWDALYSAGVEMVLNGHEHNYERFDPLTPNGILDLGRGIRQFVVGTGGASLYGFIQHPRPASMERIQRHGVLVLNLGYRRYSWNFLTVDGASRDPGRGVCHAAFSN